MVRPKGARVIWYLEFGISTIVQLYFSTPNSTQKGGETKEDTAHKNYAGLASQASGKTVAGYFQLWMKELQFKEEENV